MFYVKTKSNSLKIVKFRYYIKQVAVRWQSKAFCKNKACRAGTTIGLLRPACVR